MAEIVPADASPEKRLFISLITRDISLADAFTDLIDNSINAVIEPMADQFKSADDYRRILLDSNRHPSAKVSIILDSNEVSVSDTASGISARTAQEHVFKFGHSPSNKETTDRLSVYGIGLKRAIFKIGNHVAMWSDHIDGGFALDLDVPKWEASQEQPWKFDIEKREPAQEGSCGTNIRITRLHPDVARRIGDGVFLDQLKVRISRTYAFFLQQLIEIEVNGESIEGSNFNFGENFAQEEFESNGVTCYVSAGVAAASARGTFTQENAGWFVFCNGRTVIYADKTPLTGWTGRPNLPLFQPKHRPFLGTVIFVANDPELLPWTTTKAAINGESAVWQEARRRMIITGKEITSVLDERYSDDGTEITSQDIREMGGKPVGVLQATSSGARRFNTKTRQPSPTMRVQYDAKRTDVERVARYLRKPNMGGSAVGLYTFEYFLRNKVGVDE